MTCKNCHSELTETSKFCNTCGAKVVKERITFKGLLSDVSQDIFGWDNKYFVTIKELVVRPGHLLREYFVGTRKKYVNPFTFLALGLAINLFFFNAFDEEFLSMMDANSKAQSEWMGKMLGNRPSSPAFQEQQMELNTKMNRLMLKYFNLLTVLLMPLYTFLAFLVYRKPYNYGEHLVVNSYVQGLSFLSSTVAFLLSIWIYPVFFHLTLPLAILYYAYIYGKLYGLSIGLSILKVVIFLGILASVFISLFIVTALITVIVIYISKLVG